MTDPTKVITLGAIKLVMPSTARMVRLYKSCPTAATAYTMEEAGVDYIVPTAKKLWILKSQFYANAATSTLKIWKHTVADTVGGTQIDSLYLTAATLESYDHFISVEAAKYVNVIPDFSNANQMSIYGIELDV